MTRLRLSVAPVVLGLFPFLMACGGASPGSSFEEQQQTREAEQPASEQALATFAESHGATPIEVGFLGFERSFTAQLQDELEGSVVAFRGSLVDIVRTSTGTGGDYEVIFTLSASLFGRTLVTLSTSEQDAAPLLTLSPGFTFLVAARIDRVAPMTLELESCGEPDCNQVGLQVNTFFASYHISGRAIAMQQGQPPPDSLLTLE